MSDSRIDAAPWPWGVWEDCLGASAMDVDGVGVASVTKGAGISTSTGASTEPGSEKQES